MSLIQIDKPNKGNKTSKAIDLDPKPTAEIADPKYIALSRVNFIAMCKYYGVPYKTEMPFFAGKLFADIPLENHFEEATKENARIAEKFNAELDAWNLRHPEEKK